jgi:ankyrin repeat protein
MHHGHSHDGGKCAHSHGSGGGGGGGGFFNVGFGDDDESKQKLMMRPPPMMMQTGDASNNGSGMTPMMMMMPQQMTPQMMEFAKKMHEQRQILMKEFMEQGGNSNPQAVQDLMTKASQIQAQAMAQFKAASLASSSSSSDNSSSAGQSINPSSLDILNNKTNSSTTNKADSASNLLNANLNASKLDELINSNNSNKNFQSGQPKKVKDQDEENKILDAIANKDYSSLNAIKATQYGVLDRLKELVESGECDPHKPDSENVYLLHWAAINNRLDIAKYLISLGCDVDQIGGELESTPLNWAARSGHVMMVILLMQSGANPKLLDIEGFSTIHLATMFAHSNVVAYLLVHGVDVINSFDLLFLKIISLTILALKLLLVKKFLKY